MVTVTGAETRPCGNCSIHHHALQIWRESFIPHAEQICGWNMLMRGICDAHRLRRHRLCAQLCHLLLLFSLWQIIVEARRRVQHHHCPIAVELRDG